MNRGLDDVQRKSKGIADAFADAADFADARRIAVGVFVLQEVKVEGGLQGKIAI